MSVGVVVCVECERLRRFGHVVRRDEAEIL